MKRLMIGIIALMTAIAAGASSLTLTAADSYVTRGMVCNPDPVLQGYLSLDNGDQLCFDIFSNFELTDQLENKYKITELDPIVNYTFEYTNGLSLNIGVAQYLFPNTEWKPTTELFAKLIHSYFNITYWYDVDEVNSWYSSVSITPNYMVNKWLSVGAIGTVGYGGAGYNKFYYNVDQIDINDTTVGLWIDVATDPINTTFSINRTWLLSSDIKEGSKTLYGEDNSIAITLSINYTF